MIARPNAFPDDRRTVIFVVTLALAFSVACGGRENGDPQASPSKASEPTPSITTATPTDRSSDGAGKPLFTDEEAKNIAALTEQRRAVNLMGNKTIRIDPEPGRNTIDLPDDFPADIPLPAGASPTRYVSSPQDGTMMTVVIDESPGSAHGYFLDELYYVACAKRLDFGYVDHPPLAPAVLALNRALLGGAWNVHRRLIR